MLLFFSKNCIEVWLIFSVALSSVAQPCDSVIHRENICSFLYSLSCGLSLDIEYSSLCSTLGLSFLMFLVFPTPSSPLPHTLPHGNCMDSPFWFLDELSYITC